MTFHILRRTNVRNAVRLSRPNSGSWGATAAGPPAARPMPCAGYNVGCVSGPPVPGPQFRLTRSPADFVSKRRKPNSSLVIHFLIWWPLLFVPAGLLTVLIAAAVPSTPDLLLISLPFVLSAAVTARLTFRIAHDNPPWPRCTGCEYDISGLPANTSRCPECGTLLDASVGSPAS